MTIKSGDTVTLDYEGKLESGEIFDSTYHGEHTHPMTFVCGKGQVIRGFDEAVIGMEKDEEKEISILPEEAYGKYNEELKRDIPRTALPQDQEPKEGMILLVRSPEGHEIPVKITSVDAENITIDLNHPLAGKKLIFKIKIVKYNPGK